MRARPTWTMHVSCPSCAVPLHFSMQGFLMAEGSHNCSWCGAAMWADRRQLILLHECEQRGDWPEWAEEYPEGVRLLAADTIQLPAFGRLRVDVESRGQAPAVGASPEGWAR